MAITARFSTRGTLTVQGDTLANAIDFSRSAAGTILVNGGAVAIAGGPATVLNTRLIQVAGGDGDDRVTMDESAGPLPRTSLSGGNGNDSLTAGSGDDLLLGDAGNDTLASRGGVDLVHGGDGDDLVLGGPGNDFVHGDAGDDRFAWNPGDGSDLVEGGPGTDTLLFAGSDAGEQIGIAANGGRVAFQRDIGTVTMDLGGIERIEFRALGGADRIAVGNLAGTEVSRIDLDLRGAAGSGDGAADTVAVEAGGGDDVLGVAGAASGVAVSGLASAVNVVFFDGNDHLTLNAGGGDDVVNASGLEADGIRLEVDGGPGNDLLIGGKGGDLLAGGDGNDTALMGAGDDRFVWNPGDDSDIVEGQAGSDTLQFNGANVAERIGLEANGGRVILSRDIGTVLMDLNDTETIRFAALGGADTVTVGDLGGTDVTLVVVDLAGAAGGGDGAADTVIVNATLGDDVVIVTGDAGGVSVFGLAAQIDLVGFEPGVDRLVVNLLAGDDVLEASGLAASGPALTGDGGSGNDVMVGGDGNDVLLGGPGDDVLLGGSGLDVIDGGPGDDVEIQLVGQATSRAAMV